MLKVFAGADPQVVYANRGDFHRGKLAELEGYLASLREGSEEPRTDKWRGAEATLIAGINYQKQMIDSIERFIEHPE